MKLVGVLPVRNESWILRCTLPAMLTWLDEVVVLLHGCTDRSEAIVKQLAGDGGGRVSRLYRDADEHWQEMEHRQLLLEAARNRGATHIAYLDADEAVTSNVVPKMREWIGALPPGGVLQLPMIPVWSSPYQMRVDPCVWTQASLTVAVADAPGLCWKDREGYQHHNRNPRGSKLTPSPVDRGMGGGLHFQFCDQRRLRWKHRLYKMTERIRWPNRMSAQAVDREYSMALDEAGLQLSDLPEPWVAGLQLDRIQIGLAPWHRAECHRLWKKHGPKKFEGLELWGFGPQA